MVRLDSTDTHAPNLKVKRKNVEEDRQTAKKQKTKFAADHHAMVYKSAFTQATIPEEVLEGFTVAAVNNLDIIGLVQDQKRSKHNNALLSLQIDRIAMKMKQKLDLTKIHPLPGITRNDLSKRAFCFLAYCAFVLGIVTASDKARTLMKGKDKVLYNETQGSLRRYNRPESEKKTELLRLPKKWTEELLNQASEKAVNELIKHNLTNADPKGHAIVEKYLEEVAERFEAKWREQRLNLWEMDKQKIELNKQVYRLALFEAIQLTDREKALKIRED